jgi:CubicO group peptidase (beta-lactamase class C family)
VLRWCRPASFAAPRKTSQACSARSLRTPIGPACFPQRSTRCGSHRYGYGWNHGHYLEQPVAWHSGATARHSSSLVRLPALGVGFVVLADTPAGLWQDPVDALARDLIALLAGAEPPPPPWPWERALMAALGVALLVSLLRVLAWSTRPRAARPPTRRLRRALASLGAAVVVAGALAGVPLPAAALWALRPDLVLAIVLGATLSLAAHWLRPLPGDAASRPR